MITSRTLKLSLPVATAASRAASAAATAIAKPQPRAARVLQPPPTYITTLDNGVKIGSQDLGGTYCTVGVWLDLGSRYERAGESGASSILENIFFERDSAQMKRLGSLSSFVDSYTTRDTMGLYATCPPEKAAEVVELFADMTLHPKIEGQAFERAKARAIGNLAAVDNDPPAILDHYLHAQAYMGTPLECPPHGRNHSLVDMDERTVKNFHENHVKACRIAVAAAGNVNHDAVAEAANKHFGKTGNDYVDEIPIGGAPCRYTGSYIYHREDSWPYCYGMIAVEGPGYEKLDDCVRMTMAKGFMGGWDRMRSPYQTSPYRLTQRVGWFEHTRLYDSFYYPYYGTGLWGTYFVAQGDKASNFNSENMKEWRYLSTLMTEKDTQAAINLYKNDLFRSQESHTAVADDIGRQLIRHGRVVGVPELTAIAEETNADKLQDTCYKYIYDMDPTLATFGQVAEMEFHTYWTFRWRMYWWLR